MITAKKVAEQIASFVGLSWPNDEERIYSILSLVNSIIWKSGKFNGSTKYFYVKTRSDNTIITPHGYNVLLGLNIDFKPVDIRESYFLFHKNGPTELPFVETGFDPAVYYLGDSPVFQNINNFWCSPCKTNEKSCYNLTVKGLNCGTVKSPPFTVIRANDAKGNNIYSYFKGKKKDPICVCENKTENYGIEYINGIRFPITGKCVTYHKISISEITSITKEPSLTPVEYYVSEVGSNKGTMVARLEPYETEARYKTYQISKSKCKANCILGLFKISEPQQIVDGEQPFLTNDIESIILIAKGVDKKFFQDDIQRGDKFITDGIISLSKHLRENTPNSVNRLQIDNIREIPTMI